MEVRRNKKIISISIVILIILVIGITFAWWIITRSQNGTNIVNARCFSLSIDEGEAINISNAFPINDVNGNKTAPYTFTVTNTCNATFDYQINLESTVGTTLLPDYIKVSLNKGTPFLLSSKESVATYETGSTDARKLLVGSLGAGNSVTYDLRLWLDYDSTIEQSANKIFNSKIIVVNSVGTRNIEYKDSVIATAPEVFTGMLPIKYEGNTMKVADTLSNVGWYDYANHEWANAVLVKYSDSTIENKYFNNDNTPKVGVTVDMEDVLQMYVWIPRYRYKLWNAGNGTSNPQAIEIEFVSTDTKNDSTKQESAYQNGEWLVHPAFTFGDTELSGIWVGKFEMSGTSANPTILPNQKSFTSINVSTMYNTLHNMISLNSSVYGISNEEVDTRMLKNSEWGAVAYLTNSIYGRYTNSTTCIASGCEVWINNVNTGYGNLGAAQYTGQPQYGPSITGCAGGAVSETWNNNKTACEENYDWLNNGVNASTTGNKTGIYDMSGGAWEYVMGVMYDSDGTTPRYQSSGFNASTMPASKYYDTYAYQASELDGNNVTGEAAETSLARYHLGEGTRETVTRLAMKTGAGWYNDATYELFSSGPWVGRGGYYNNGSSAGLFYFNRSYGGSGSNYSFRASLSSK